MNDDNEVQNIRFRGEGITWGPEGAVVPPELLEIQKEWAEKANDYGDIGSCVLGAKFTFDYKGQSYEMPPISRWQGSCSWEAFVPEVKEKLTNIGAVNIKFNCGFLD